MEENNISMEATPEQTAPVAEQPAAEQPVTEQPAPEQAAVPAAEQAAPVAEQPAPAPAPSPVSFAPATLLSRLTDHRRLLAVAAGAVAVILLLILLLGSLGGERYTVKTHAGWEIETDDGERTVFFDQKKPVTVQDVRDTGSSGFSPDGQTYLYITADDTLYMLQAGDKQGKKIADNVEDFVFAPSGERFLFISNEQDVYLGRCGKTATDLVIADSSSIDVITASRDMSVILYGIDGDYYWYDGKKEKIDWKEEYRPVVLSEGGKYIYSTKENTLYVQKGVDGERVKLGSGTTFAKFVACNRDGNEMLYTCDGATYLSVNGKKGVKVLGKAVSEVLAPRFAIRTGLIGLAMYYYEADTLIDCPVVVYTDGTGLCSVYTLGKDTEKTVKNLSKAMNVSLAADGEALLAYKDGGLVRVTDTGKENAGTGITGDVMPGGAYSYQCSRDLEKVYFLNDDHDLYYVKGNGKPKAVSGGSDVESFWLSCDDKTCFARIDGELYRSVSGGKMKRVSGLEEVSSVYVEPTFVLVYTADAVYRSDGDDDFEKIADLDN